MSNNMEKEIEQLVPYPTKLFIDVSGLEPMHGNSWNAPVYSEVWGVPIETTSADSIAVLRAIQSRVAARDNVPGMAHGVFGMQDAVFRSKSWACIIGAWVKDAILTDDEFRELERFAFHKGADIVMLALIRTHAGKNEFDMEQWDNIVKAFRLKEKKRGHRNLIKPIKEKITKIKQKITKKNNK